MNKIKYFLKQFIFLKALNSPFKPFKLKWYIGKVAIGVPYFLPRKWRNLTEKEIEIEAKESYNKLEEEFKTKVTLKLIEDLKHLYLRKLDLILQDQVGKQNGVVQIIDLNMLH